jgi:hypothetical protein
MAGAVISRALELDCEAVYWELWRPNALGRKFYERLDAEETSALAIMRLAAERLSSVMRP